MFSTSSLLRKSRFGFSNRKVVLSILAVVSFAAAISLSMRLAQSAPAGPPSPQQPPTTAARPVVKLEVPGQALIGETVTFKVKFDNVGTAVGYGPFVDIVLDAGGANIAKPTPTPPGAACACDGITFLGARMIGVNGGPLILTPAPSGFPTNTTCINSSTSVQHPFKGSGVFDLTLPPGAQLITLALPFGSFQPDQPEIVVEVTARISNLADAGHPLTISARGGFQFGEKDALDNPNGPPMPDPPILSDYDSSGGQGVASPLWIEQATTTPTVMIIKKAYSGPEDETATGPNFPRLYTLTVDIADTQKVDNVILTDCLPDNMAFVQFMSITAGGTSSGPPTVGSAASSNCFMVTWPTLTGIPGADATAEFQFFIPEKDAFGNLILESNCANRLSNNKITATGQWTPTDTCDTTPPPPITVTAIPAEHILTDKCIALQKSRPTISTPTGASGFTPDDTLRYELNFQISDFKTFGDLEVTDLLSDGQSLTTPAPTLTVTDKFGTTMGSFDSSDLIVTSTNVVGTDKCLATPGATSLTFKVSQKMMTVAPPIPRHAAGILTGGLATAPPVPPSTGAIGTIVFFVKIDDVFKNTSLADPSVDKEDPLSNCAEIKGNSLENEDPPALPATVESTPSDDSRVGFSIVGDTLNKTVYAVKRGSGFVCAPTGTNSDKGLCSNLPGPPQEVRPGDEVTFRIEKIIPSSDFEQLTIEDWLPLPIFNIAGISFNNAICGIPGTNSGCLGPDDTLHPLVTPRPLFSASPPPGANRIKFEYLDFDHIDNQPRKIDLLFTSTVRNDPFADRLFLTNEVLECEKNSFGTTFCQVAIAQVNLREPDLKIRKGAIATDNPHGLFNQAIPGPSPSPTPAIATAQAPAGVTFGLTGFTGTISSTNLLGLINSDLSNVDANDIVTFAITIENQGGHPAFDVKLDDIFPADCFTVDQNTIKANLGSGATVSPVLTTIAGGFSLSFPAPIVGLDANTNPGDNIVVVIFQAKVKTDITPGCCQNQARITQYASTSNGPNFVTAGFNPPYADTAEVCTRPTLTKSVVATSEAHTAPETSLLGTPQVAIGEVVRYHVDVVVPEGATLTNVQLTDVLPPGMKYLNDNTARIAFVSNQMVFTHTAFVGNFDVSGNSPASSSVLNGLDPLPIGVSPSASACGAAAIFKLGDIKNNDIDFDLEYVSLEFNALVCNEAGNQNGTSLSDTIIMSVDVSGVATSNAISVTVVEPNLTITKVASPSTVVQGATVPYTVTITNSSLVDAFDVQFADTLPVGLILEPASVNVTGGCFSPTVVNTVPSVTCARIIVGGVVTITYRALADPITCPVTLTNNARTTWTSLPGPNGTTTNSQPMSTTPGNSGAPDGERDGVTAPLTLNDYAASASSPLSVRCPPCVSAPAGIVNWWPFDETGGTISNDIGGVVNNLGTHNNGPTPTSGKVGGALCFDGANDYIEVADHPEIDFPSSCPSGVDGAFTIDAWVRTSDSTGVDTILDKRVNPNRPIGYSLFLVDGRLGFQLADGGSGPGGICGTGPGFPCTNYVAPTTSANVASGDWHLVAVTVTKCPTPVGKMYVDGNLVLTFTPRTGDIDNSAALQIGRRDPAFSETHFNGCIDELEFFNRDLAESEIQAIYNARSSGKCKCPPITLNPAAGALPATLINSPYKLTFTAGGGCSSLFTFSVTSGSLPPGLTLSPSGVLSGTPTQTGIFTFTVTATDSCGCTKSQTYTLSVDKCPMVPLTLFNTGVANDGSLLAAGAPDLHYALVNTGLNPPPVPPPAVVLAQNQIQAYVANNAISQWIGPNVNPLSNSPVGFYTYRITFAMPAGADLNTVIISGRWASDNEAAIFLNGQATNLTTGPADFGSFTPFAITGPANFQQNTNVIEFQVRNRGVGGGPSPTATGLRVEINGSVTCCPQPNKGTLIIKKNTVGGDNTFGYTTTGAGLSAFNITTSGGTQSQTFSNISPGPKTVTESSLPAGWSFTTLTCSDPDGGTTVSGQTANIDLDAGETVMCTYTNTRCAITLNPAAGPLTAAFVNTPYSQTFTTTGGSCGAPTFSVTSGALPSGLTLSPNGVLSGTATQVGDFSFSVTATDSCGCSQTQSYTLKVQSEENKVQTKALVISAFRQNGPNGAGDEFVEIFNPSTAPVTVSSLSGPGGDIGVFSSAGKGTASNDVTLRCLIPGATVIKGRGWFLCGGSQYSLGNLGTNGGTFHSAPDAPILGDIPNDAGLVLLNVGTNNVTVSSTDFLSGGNPAVVLDSVGFRPYGPGAPANAEPSLSSKYCEGTCLQPVGDASTVASPACPATVDQAGAAFPVLSGGFVGGVAVCYGESGQYQIGRRRSQQQFKVGTGSLHRDTDNNADDFILLAPDPSIANVGQAITGSGGLTSVLGAAGPHSTKSPPIVGQGIYTGAAFDLGNTNQFDPGNAQRQYGSGSNILNPNNNPLGTFLLRIRFTNNGNAPVSGVRFRIDDITGLCGPQSGAYATGTGGGSPHTPPPTTFGSTAQTATQEARNLRSSSPSCQGEGSDTGLFTAVLKGVNHNSEFISQPSDGTVFFVNGSVLEDVVTTAGPTSLSPLGGGGNNSYVINSNLSPNALGDGVSGGPGSFAVAQPNVGSTSSSSRVLRVAFKFGVVKAGRFKLLIGREAFGPTPVN